MLMQPFHQGEVVGEAAKDGHGSVGVGIDQAGHHHTAGYVQGFGGTESRLHGFSGADRDDFSAAHRYPARVKALIPVVQCQHQAVEEQEIRGCGFRFI